MPFAHVVNPPSLVHFISPSVLHEPLIDDEEDDEEEDEEPVVLLEEQFFLFFPLFFLHEVVSGAGEVASGAGEVVSGAGEVVSGAGEVVSGAGEVSPPLDPPKERAILAETSAGIGPEPFSFPVFAGSPVGVSIVGKSGGKLALVISLIGNGVVELP